MTSLTDLPLRRKLTLVIVGTCSVVLLAACLALATYELIDYRRGMVRDATLLADILGANTRASLIFDDGEAATGLLRALHAEPHIVAARLYDRTGKPFADYARGDAMSAPAPLLQAEEGHHFNDGLLILARPVELDGKPIGMLCLAIDLHGMYERLGLFALITLAVLAGSALLAVALATRLQRPISQPILALAELARVVAERDDLTLRAAAAGRDELGQLAGAFNYMLDRLHGQNQALREGEARVRAVLDSALSAVVVMSARGRISEWNARAEVLFGRSRAEVLGGDLATLIIPERFRAAHRDGLARFAASGEAPVLGKALELTALRRDGSEFPVELSINALVTGGETTFCGFVTDISERKRMAEMQVRLAAVVESSDDAIISKGLDGLVATWNPGAERLFGYSAAETVGQAMRGCIPPELVAEEIEVDARVLRGEKVVNFATARFHKDGRRIDISISVAPIVDELGQVVGLSKIARDISEQKRGELRVREQLTRLDLLNRITRAIGERLDLDSVFQVVIRSLEEDLPVDFAAVCLYDAAKAELTVNNVGVGSMDLALAMSLPAKAVMPVGTNGLARCVNGHLVHEPDLSTSSHPLPQRLVTAGLHAMVAAPLVVESGVFGILLVARRAANSFSSGECEFLRQASEHTALAAHQAQLYGALQGAYDDLRQTQQTVMQQERLRALGQMASGIAHDINNAISPVMLYTEALLEHEKELSPRARKYLETISRAVGDVAHTVARMREFYRQREQQFTPTAVDLNELAHQVLDLSRARWQDMPQQRGVSIQVNEELEARLPAIMAVASEIREALINLVFNACDAMPDGGVLTLRTRLVASDGGAGSAGLDRVVIEVADTGVGMDEETRRRCLEPFFTTKGERGTGLGLAMVYGVLQRHQAELVIDSAVGAGTIFRIVFIAGSNSLGEEQHGSERPAGPLRILSVDDDPIILRSLCDALEIEGHQVVTANGGQAGIDTFVRARSDAEPFDVVITDLGMPHVDGRKVAAAVKRISPATPVLMLTGWGQRLVAEGDIPAHVDEVLSKPPKLRELRDALARATRAKPDGA